MEMSGVIFISLVLLCGVRDIHADTNLTDFSTKLNLLERTIQAWNGTTVDLGTEMNNNFDLLELSLKEELTDTFIPALIKPLVKQAITGILKEEYIGNIISGRVLDIVKSLKASIHNTKTQLRSVKRQFRKVKRERDSYKESLDKLQGEMTKDLQGIQQRIQELEDSDALRENQIQDLTEQKQKASSDPSHGERAAEMTTVTTHASSDPRPTTSDPSQTTRTPVTTTKKPATQATPSPADCEDLIDASWRGNLEEVKRILSQGVDVNCRWGRRWSRTPVMWAAYRGHRDVVELLVSRGADVSLVDYFGDNILHFACRGGDMETVEFVLSLNVVDINARNNYGRTAADRARVRGHTRLADLLVSRGAQ